MVSVAHPLSSLHGLFWLRPLPSVGGLNGHRLVHEVTFSPIPVTGGGDRDALFERVELGMSAKLLHKLRASGFEQLDVRRAVPRHLVDEVEDEPLGHASVVPRVEVGEFLLRHPRRIVRVFWRHDSLVLLVSARLNLWGKHPLCNSVNPKAEEKEARENGRKQRESLKVSLSEEKLIIFTPTVTIAVTSRWFAYMY